MSTGTTRSPALPEPPEEYSQEYMNNLLRTLRLYFSQLDNPGPSAGSTERTGGEVVAALNFSQRIAGQSSEIISFPTEADSSGGKLRKGDLFYDSTAANVVKIQT
jgi:hypothetical protein